jgi:hypothetical protein
MNKHDTPIHNQEQQACRHSHGCTKRQAAMITSILRKLQKKAASRCGYECMRKINTCNPLHSTRAASRFIYECVCGHVSAAASPVSTEDPERRWLIQAPPPPTQWSCIRKQIQIEVKCFYVIISVD